MHNKTKEKITKCLTKFKTHLLSTFPLTVRAYISVGIALVLSSTLLYAPGLQKAYKETKNKEKLLEAENKLLTETVISLDNKLSDTSKKLESIEKNYENLTSELEKIAAELKETEKDAAEKQEQLDGILAEEESKKEDLENTIEELIDTFGESNISRSGAELYSSLTKIDNAKDIIAVYLSDNPKSTEYINLLNEEKEKIEDRIKRYPDFEPTEGKISQYFGNNSYFSGNKLITRYHNGLDIYSFNPGSICSAAYGTVIETQKTDNGGLGLYVKIDHGNGFVTLYAHLKEINVNVGQTVEKGQRIGVMGSSGAATGVHVHIEVFLNGHRTDPLNYMYPEYKR